MQLINDTLSALSISAPQSSSNLAVYPLIAPAGLDPDYLVLDEALARKLARVTEVSAGGSVPELAFENQADQGVLLLDGEELVGARQNRVLNITILVGGHKSVVIPVSCVEHGRWRYNSDEFASADHALFSKARAKKARRFSSGKERLSAGHLTGTGYLVRRCGTNLISISHPTASAYFFSEVSDGACLPADSRRETVLFVVPMREATASCVRPARERAASISLATVYSTARA